MKITKLFDLVLDDYEMNEQSSKPSVENHIKKLAWFGDMDIKFVNKALCLDYIKERRGEGAANSTINRELAVLKRGFSLYREDHPEFSMPFIPTLKENNARKLAYTKRQYDAVLSKIVPAYAGPVTFAYISSWREGTILDLQWGLNVDDAFETVVAQGEQTKNGEGLVIPLDVAPFTLLRELLQARWEVRQGPYVFHNGKGDKLTKGGLIKALARAHKAAEVPYGRTVKGGLTFHDFKKSAIRNMLRVHRVPIDIVMKISGNLTREVFDKNYNNAIDEQDIRRAFHLREPKVPGTSDDEELGSKSGKRRTRFEGSNPSLSAIFLFIIAYVTSLFRKS